MRATEDEAEPLEHRTSPHLVVCLKHAPDVDGVDDALLVRFGRISPDRRPEIPLGQSSSPERAAVLARGALFVIVR